MWHECCMNWCLFAPFFYISLHRVHLWVAKQKQRPCQPGDACSTTGAQPGFQTLLTTWNNGRRANRTSRAASQGTSSSSGSLTAAAGLRLTRQGSLKLHSSILRGGLGLLTSANICLLNKRFRIKKRTALRLHVYMLFISHLCSKH